MKKHFILALVLVLTLSVFTGCGNRRNPTGMNPTDMTMAPTVAPTTTPTGEATEHMTHPTEHATTATEHIVPNVTEESSASAPSNSGEQTNATENGGTQARTIR